MSQPVLAHEAESTTTAKEVAADSFDEVIRFKVNGIGKQYGFAMRVCSLAEEKVMRQQFTTIENDEDGSKNFAINVELLRKFTTEAIKVTTADGAAGQSSIQSIFAKQTPIIERVAEKAVLTYLQSLNLSASFL